MGLVENVKFLNPKFHGNLLKSVEMQAKQNREKVIFNK
jgi:hypothetical protein